MKRKIKQFFRSKTLNVSLLIGLLGALEATQGYLKQFLPDNAFGIFMIVLALVMAYLRYKTTVPVKDK